MQMLEGGMKDFIKAFLFGPITWQAFWLGMVIAAAIWVALGQFTGYHVAGLFGVVIGRYMLGKP